MARKEVLLIWIAVEFCALLLVSYMPESSAEDDAPLTKFSHTVGGPTLKFLYWLVFTLSRLLYVNL